MSSLRWAVLTCLLAAVTGVVCYWVGLTRAEEPVARAEPPAMRVAAPGLLALDEVRRPPPDRTSLVRDRAYVRGREDGLAEGRRAARRWVRAQLARAARSGSRARGSRSGRAP